MHFWKFRSSIRTNPTFLFICTALENKQSCKPLWHYLKYTCDLVAGTRRKLINRRVHTEAERGGRSDEAENVYTALRNNNRVPAELTMIQQSVFYSLYSIKLLFTEFPAFSCLRKTLNLSRTKHRLLNSVLTLRYIFFIPIESFIVLKSIQVSNWITSIFNQQITFRSSRYKYSKWL